MKKTLSVIVGLVISTSVYSQVGINTPDPTAALDVNGDLKVRFIPPGNITDDVIVKDSEGNIKQVPRSSFGSGGGVGFSSSILGYEPQPVANRVVPPIAPGGGTVIELGCKQWAGNGHHYCAYSLSTPSNWFNTFLLAKQLGGYLSTLTSEAERTWVYDNILSNTTGYSLNNNIWLGFNKIARPGNPSIFQWITGEEFVVDWSTNPSSVEQWFNTGEPNNSGGNEGSVHILSASTSPTRRWNDSNGIVNTIFNQVIVEFNE